MKLLVCAITILIMCSSANAGVVVTDLISVTGNAHYFCRTKITFTAGDNITSFSGGYQCVSNYEAYGSISTDNSSPVAPGYERITGEPPYLHETNCIAGKDLWISSNITTWNPGSDSHTHEAGDTWTLWTCADLTPVVIDMGQNGIHLGQKGVYVDFDYFGFGYTSSSQWVQPGGDEVFLALDLNSNGVVDDGSELFGNGTWLINDGTWAANGFQALAQYDHASQGGDGDGLITKNDGIWDRLLLWNDINADAISTTSEIGLVQDSGLASFETVPKVNNRQDPVGNWLPFWQWSENDSVKGNRKHKMVDVFFAQEPSE